MGRPDISYLFDIYDSARFAEEFVAGMDEEAFRRDRKTQSAVVRELLIVGEAAKKVSPAFRQAHPEIAWRAMAGMRDVMIHDYRGIDLENVWIAATVSVPDLIAALEPLLPDDDIERLEETRRDDA